MSLAPLSTLVPHLHGQGLVFGAQHRRDTIVGGLWARNVTLRGFFGAGLGFRECQSAAASTLNLPGNAATNLDALADSLWELPRLWPGDRTVLVWEQASDLVTSDIVGFSRLADVLRESSERLANQPQPYGFETLLLVDGLGVS